jgi:putative heme degradation protein
MASSSSVVSDTWATGPLIDIAGIQLAAETRDLIEETLRVSGLRSRDLAARLGVSAGRVSQVLNGDGNLRMTTIGRYLWSLGFEGQLTAVSQDGRVRVAPHSGVLTRQRLTNRVPPST